jgi:hypothetical protein
LWAPQPLNDGAAVEHTRLRRRQRQRAGLGAPRRDDLAGAVEVVDEQPAARDVADDDGAVLADERRGVERALLGVFATRQRARLLGVQ